MAKIHFFSNKLLLPLCFFCTIVACTNQTRTHGDNAAFVSPVEDTVSKVWDKIKSSGELIFATLSGPGTYYEYHGREMGLQFAYVQHFAQSEGLRVRVEVVHDTVELAELLQSGGADVAGVLLPESLCNAQGLLAAGVKDSAQGSWAVSAESEDLAELLDRWYSAEVKKNVEAQVREQTAQRTQVKRKVYAPYLSKERGEISQYDAHFKRAASTIGCDWRLLAAMAYQESCFDPQAQSWAGAKGLMQLMPATAASVGLSMDKIFDPAENINAAARVMSGLYKSLSDIKSPDERLKFMLASYNGGIGHIRDAQALARKAGKSAQVWSDVGPFILHLSDPAYYRDPVVKYGYMIGSETYNYVNSVCERFRAYGGEVTGMGPRGGESSTPHRAEAKRKHTEHKIYTPDDPEFFKMQAE